jgi:LysM domain-containing protein
MNKPLWLAGAGVLAALSAGAVWVGASVSSPPHVIAAPAPAPAKVSTVPKKAAAPGVSHVGNKIYYTVQRFDIGKRQGTLTFIARRFDTTVGQLVTWNNIKDPDDISVHERLRVR